MAEQPLLYELAELLGLPPDRTTVVAEVRRQRDLRVTEVQTTAMTAQQVWTTVLAACRLARDETFSTDSEIAAALRISLKTWRRMSGPCGDQELRDLGHMELGEGGRTSRRFRLIDVLAWDAERQRRAAERRKK
jgi:hypothetical protein